ncbi:glycosyltransferase family 39 protein [Streptomyces purpureus]|uniref:glycosyltransferase family 39 protein n=1 Tax=Streptomyces purpureus TaxID=1951 RepID=UPI0003613148|nr:glycosyltransferase family 39 protein [Streptomyces purpureus]
MTPVITLRPTVPASRKPVPPGDGGGGGAPVRAVRGALRHAAPALLGYLAVRAIGLLVLARWTHLKGHGVWPALATSWDSRWYLEIADRGYQAHLGTLLDDNNLAFFPFYPALIKAVAAVTPGSRASVGLVIAVVCSLLAAWGIFAVGDRLHGRRTGTVLAVLWGAQPVALVQWMGYTESLFTALTAWALYAVLDGRWYAAGALAVAAGLTRPTGIAVAAAVTVAALLSAARGGGRTPLLAALLAPVGWFGYIGWVALRLGRWDGYFAVQKLWRNEWDGGTRTLRELRDHLVYGRDPQLFLAMVSLVLLGSLFLYVLCLADRQPAALLVFAGALLLVVLGSGGVYFPRARFLLPGFPLLLPVAVAVARARPHVAALVLGVAAVTSAWLGGYMLMVWPGPP